MSSPENTLTARRIAGAAAIRTNMNKVTADATYTMGRTEAETDRLIRQSRLYDRATRRLFEDAGLSPGMKVLDVGTGAGDVALLAADLVGPAG